MIFYEIEAKKAEASTQDRTRRSQKALAALLSSKLEVFFRKTNETAYIFPFCEQSDRVSFAAILKTKEDPASLFGRFSELLPIELTDVSFEEITFRAFSSRLDLAERSTFISDKCKVLELFELDSLEVYSYDFKFGENLVSETPEEEDLTKAAKDYLFQKTFLPELERIMTPCAQKGTHGHPVHYLVCTDDRDARKAICRSLLTALYGAGRVQNRRYAFWDYHEDERFHEQPLAALYTACQGGSVIIRLEGEFPREGRFASRGADALKKITAIAEANKNRVLTVFCIKKGCENVKDTIYGSWSGSPIIELCEGALTREDALNYLKTKAKREKIRPDKNLSDALSGAEDDFSRKTLDRIFTKWYDHKLRNSIYPQYSACQSTKATVSEEKVRGSSYEKLRKMIGLKEAKETIDKAIAYFKMQKLFADRGFSSETPSMHMIFTGNPGTAKTTVARLFAEIMKENGLLPNGHLYEVGRGDLVGKYVGSTAPLVKEAFQQAKGGVLFIDEAYALVDDRDGLFGDEAINAITQEMENNRRDTVVIFAGYPDKMEGFLKKNPGLRSRIAFHLKFEDYTAKELCSITDHIAAEHGLVLEDRAREKLSGIFEKARETSDFGNGRFARNLVEKAKMSQAQRLMQKEPDRITDHELTTLCAEDFEAPVWSAPRAGGIGYIA